MKKTITILSALAITGSPALALNAVNHKTQNLQNICKPTATKVTPNGVVNDVIDQLVSSYHFYFQVRLSNSAYNGFPAFMNQIAIDTQWQYPWPAFFFQWLDDNDFHKIGNEFPDLSKHTTHGYYHIPLVYSNRMEEHMGHFGSMWDGKSSTMRCMIWSATTSFWTTYSQNVETTYKKEAATGKVAGIMLNFGFSYDGSYHAVNPNFAFIMNS